LLPLGFAQCSLVCPSLGVNSVNAELLICSLQQTCWVTWARAWKYYGLELESWDEFKEGVGLRKLGLGSSPFQRNGIILDRTANDEIDTWDYQWIFGCWAKNVITITLCVNMIENICFT